MTFHSFSVWRKVITNSLRAPPDEQHFTGIRHSSFFIISPSILHVQRYVAAVWYASRVLMKLPLTGRFKSHITSFSEHQPVERPRGFNIMMFFDIPSLQITSRLTFALIVRAEKNAEGTTQMCNCKHIPEIPMCKVLWKTRCPGRQGHCRHAGDKRRSHVQRFVFLEKTELQASSFPYLQNHP